MKEEFPIEIGVPFYPNPSYSNKVFLDSILITAFILVGIEIMWVFMRLIGLFEPLFDETFNSILLISLIVCFFIPMSVGCIAKMFMPLYMKNTSYMLFDDEIVIKYGIITKMITHVPLKSISNVELTRGFFDRKFNLGNIVLSKEYETRGQITGISNYAEVNNFLLERVIPFETPKRAEPGELIPSELKSKLQVLQAIHSTLLDVKTTLNEIEKGQK